MRVRAALHAQPLLHARDLGDLAARVAEQRIRAGWAERAARAMNAHAEADAFAVEQCMLAIFERALGRFSLERRAA